MANDIERGLEPGRLSEPELLHELNQLHETRHETLRHAPFPTLEWHTRRTAVLEAEYLRRFPAREVDPVWPRVGVPRPV